MVSAVYYTCLLWKLAKIFCGGIQLCARLVSKSLTRSVSVLTLLSGAVWYHLHNQLPVWSLLYPKEGVGAISTKNLKIMVWCRLVPPTQAVACLVIALSQGGCGCNFNEDFEDNGL